MELAKKELLLCDLDRTRKYLDQISYNIRGIFHGDEPAAAMAYQPVDTAEHLITALQIFTYALEKLSAFERKESELPMVNSIVLAIRAILENARITAARLRSEISGEYDTLLTDSIEVLEEVTDDIEEIFFEMPQDEQFMKAVNKLLDSK